MKPIPYGKQNITEDDLLAVNEALQADFLTQGPQISAFENAFATYIGCKYAVAVSNGTAALHLSALALGVNENSRVICPPITFAASANCVRYCGGTVDFCDIDPKTYLIDLVALRKKLETAPKGTYQGIIPVDFAGRAVNLEEVKKLAAEFGLWILEDACHAPGGFFTDSKGKQQWCGNGNFAELAIFSFHPVKHIACGEGGMITTNDEKLYQKLLTLRTHGITRNPDLFVNSTEFAGGSSTADGYPVWYMEMQELGYNYRLTDFQAALGLSQLKRAGEGINRRRQIAQKYTEAFANDPNILGHSGNAEGHAYHLYVIEAQNRLELFNYLRDKQIFAQIHYIPVHLMPYYRNLGWQEGQFPNAENYYKHCISLPMFPNLTDEEQTYIINSIKDFYRG